MKITTTIIIIFINIYGYILMGVDKNRAKKGKYRISERALWVTALCLGAVGVTIGMFVFRHKTKHLQFRIGLPILLMIELGILYLISK